ncbi:ATP-binding protein [Bacillus cereus]|uniref:ATP-binding protein n=1 Tax=Bacillus cereus TaxID=1396 RepID=UPI001E5CE0A1|nr:ATP-binding protein [Bacillus cereus]MCC2453343.1 ATP-binding protein [Bacillus cereus]
MNIQLPFRFTRDTMYNFLGRVISDGEPVEPEITFDFTNLDYIEPVAITILSNTLQWLDKNDIVTGFRLPNQSQIGSRRNCPIKYLDDSMFFRTFLGESLTPTAAVRPTTRPLELVNYNRSLFWMEQIFIPWLARRLEVQPVALSGISTCVGEIFNNINDHSTEHIGCIYAQHYPRWNLVKVAISDFGVGVPAAIQSQLPNLTDEEALLQAFEEGFSTQSTPGNRGAGFTNITKAIEANQGFAYIHSNAGIIKCDSGENGIQISSSTAPGYYPGTLFEIILNTNNIYNENYEEEFVW